MPPEQFKITDYIPQADTGTDQLWDNFEKMLEQIKNPYLSELFEKIFSNRTREDFCLAPGGKKIHHAYSGGLIEHSLETASIAARIYSLFQKNMDKDILVAGALLHDIGKIQEYDLNSISFQLTNRGMLHGHLILGRDILLEAAAKVRGFPAELENEMSHLILSHHGCREWGSPEPPKTIEAYALFYADLTSARLNQADEIVSSIDNNETWSRWNRLLETSLYKPLRKYDSGTADSEGYKKD